MKLRIFFFALLFVSLYFGVTYFIDFFNKNPNIGIEFTGSFLLFVILGVLLQIIAHFVRAAKSKYLLDNIRKSDSLILFKGLAVGNLFNSLLPLRLGEFIRAFYTGDALSISKTTVFMSIVFERIIDGFILGFCFIIGGIVINDVSAEASSFIIKAGIALLVFALFLWVMLQIIKSENKHLLRCIYGISSLFNEHISNRTRMMAWSGIYGTKLMLSNKLSLRKYYAASMGMWLLYFSSITCIVIAFFQSLPITQLWYTVQVCFAGVGTPVGPGYIGTFYSIVATQLNKIDVGNVGGFVVFTWFVLTIPISLIGIYVLIRQRLGVKKEIPKQEALINKLYRESDISSEFKHFLDAYFKGERINQILTQAELNDDFRLIKSFKGGSNAHTMLVWQNEELRVKKITLPQYADKLEAQAQWLLDREYKPNLPKVVEQDKNDSYYSFDLAYHEDYFPFFEFIHSHSIRQSTQIIGKVLHFMDRHVYEKIATNDNRANVDDYIQNKILSKVTDTANVNHEISQLIACKKLEVNGIAYDNLLQVVDKIKQNEKAMQDLAHYQETPIHGDLTIDNLIVSSEGEFMVIDPNNENQVSTPTVDYGKLYQSLHSGYEFLIQLDQCVVKDNSVHFEETKSQKYEEIFKHLDRELRESLNISEYKTILFHEAVHYCRMLTYRANINPETVAVFYATAVKLFNEFLHQYE